MQITRYNESKVDARSVNLTNQIDTVDIDVPVGFSIPNGSFRLWEQTPITFTHFVANIPSYDGDRVFIITNIVCINSEVTEYYYDIDYLKDYYYRNHTSDGVLPLKNTLISSIYPPPTTTINSIFPVNTHVTPIAETVTETNGYKMDFSRPFVVTSMARSSDNSRYALKNSNNIPISTKALYVFDSTADFEDLLVWILSGDRNSSYDLQPWETGAFTSFYSNITKAFYSPCTLPDTATITPTNIINYSGADGRGCVKDFTGSSLAGKISFINLPTGNGIITNEFNTGIGFQFMSANDLPPYKKYEAYVPYIGWYEIPVNEIFPMSSLSDGNLYVKMYFDLINGLVSCRFGKGVSSSGGIVNVTYSAYQTPYVPLPEISLPTSNYATNSIRTDTQYQSSMTSNAISSLMGIGTGLVTGNSALIGDSIISSATNMMNAEIQREQAQGLNKLGGFTSGRDSSIGQVDREFKLRTTSFHQSLTYAEAIELYGHPLNEYEDILYFNTHEINNKIWIDSSNSKILGTPSYISNLRSSLSFTYLTYTPVTS